MLLRRLGLLAAALLLLSMLAYGVRPPAPAQESIPIVAPTAAEATTVDETLDAADAGPATVDVSPGDHVRLTVVAHALDTVELVGMGQIAAVSAELPATFDLRADRPGEYPVVLQEADRTVGILVVR